MIVRSLRARLLLAIGTIVAAVLLAVGLFSSFTVKREFNRFLIRQSSDHAQQAADHLEAHYRLQGSWEGVPRVLAELHRENRGRMILADANRQVIARVPAKLDAYAIEIGPQDDLSMRREGPLREQIRLRGGGHVIEDASGRRVGLFFLLPPEDGNRALRRSFGGSTDRWLLFVIAGAALLAFIVMLVTLRRIFAPVESLTAGVRSLAGGKLDTRVPARGEDEIAELARSFNAMAEALERNEKARRNMVSDVAHELRTPLTNIRVQIEAAQDGVVPADEKLFASIADDAETLSRLVDDLQQLSLAEAGQLRLELAEVSVAEIVARAVEGLGVAATRPLWRRLQPASAVGEGDSPAEAGATNEPPAATQKPSIHIDVPSDLVVRADFRRIVQVLRNLVVNALAHAKSSIEITASREGEKIAVRVADDGPGVPPEHIARIFDRFYRADASRSRTTGGAGLGLAIAKELVELHGGTIRVTNRANGGAEFVFTL